jgi:hypothetical protein
MIKTCLAPTRFRLALVCMGFLLVIALAYPTAVGAQARGENDIPEELWQLYPLDPTKTDTSHAETVQPRLPQPRPQAQPDSAVQTRSESPNAQAKPSDQPDLGRSLAFPLLGALLGLLVILLVVATVRNSAFAIAGEYLARAGSTLVSPLRGATSAPRYVGRGGSAVVFPLRALPRLPRRIGPLLLWLLRALAGVVTQVARPVGSAVAALGYASKRALWNRGATLLSYAIVTTVAVLLVALLLQLLQSLR